MMLAPETDLDLYEHSEDFVYLIQCPMTRFVKIGRSRNPQQRLEAIRTSSPTNLVLVLRVPENTGWTERSLHRQMQHAKAEREWYYPTPDLIHWAQSKGGKLLPLNHDSPDRRIDAQTRNMIADTAVELMLRDSREIVKQWCAMRDRCDRLEIENEILRGECDRAPEPDTFDAIL